jgi:hypothetical protein
LLEGAAMIWQEGGLPAIDREGCNRAHGTVGGRS